MPVRSQLVLLTRNAQACTKHAASPGCIVHTRSQQPHWSMHLQCCPLHQLLQPLPCIRHQGGHLHTLTPRCQLPTSSSHPASPLGQQGCPCSVRGVCGTAWRVLDCSKMVLPGNLWGQATGGWSGQEALWWVVQSSICACLD
jgi:hypothetical protein